MQTHMPAPTEHSAKQQQQEHNPAQLAAEPQTRFEDARPDATQLRSNQALMGSSPQQQQHLALQAKMNAGASTQQAHALQAKMAAGTVAQRVEEEEPLQAKAECDTAQREQTSQAPKPNNTGLPNQLKAGIESLSGMSMDNVKVHYNSDKPAQLNAHAYAQGSEIHVAPGQEQHLPHEAWHVVQQAQGRVKPTMQMKGNVPVNDDAGLEAEADLMGAKALSVSQQVGNSDATPTGSINAVANQPVQRLIVTDKDAPKDFVIMASIGAYLEHKGDQNVGLIPGSAYNNINPGSEALFVIAHGDSSAIAGLSPKAMGDELEAKGRAIPAGITRINLAACESGKESGPQKQDSYAHNLKARLNGYTDLQVLGVPGEAAITNLSNAKENVVANIDEALLVDARLRKKLDQDLGVTAGEYMDTLSGDIKERAKQAASNQHIQEFFKDFLTEDVFDKNAEVTRAK